MTNPSNATPQNTGHIKASTTPGAYQALCKPAVILERSEPRWFLLFRRGSFAFTPRCVSVLVADG
jgi:hypothetical protein